MTDDARPETVNAGTEEEDECEPDHSWEYLYSVSQCVRCGVEVVDD